jgi:hypothetical protein
VVDPQPGPTQPRLTGVVVVAFADVGDGTDEGDEVLGSAGRGSDLKAVVEGNVDDEAFVNLFPVALRLRRP